MINDQNIPVIGFAAYSGTGKTTLLVRLLPIFKERGIKTAVIKHAHHSFEIDYKGKDSYRLRKAGADQMLIGSDKRWALITEIENKKKPTLKDMLQHLETDNLDLILVEGFKPECMYKIEVCRPSLGKAPFYPGDKSIIAVATDAVLPVSTNLPVFDLNQPEPIADFIIDDFINSYHQKVANLDKNPNG